MSYVDTQDLNNYTIEAIDGEIGNIEDFYFDENVFYLRYLLVDTEPFLLRNLVLVSPTSFERIDPINKKVTLSITKNQLENSPSFDSKDTVSRTYEKAYYDYFSWPYYWGADTRAWAIGPYGVPWGYYDETRSEPAPKEGNNILKNDVRESSLRSAKEVESYAIRGIDDEFGHVQGFIIDGNTLSIDFIIVDTINFFPSKNVLLRPEWVERISWHTETVSFPFSKDLIKSAPAYQSGKLDKEFIKRTDEHFKEAISGYAKNEVSEGQSDRPMIFDIKARRDNLNDISIRETVVGDIPSGLFVVTTENSESKEVEGFLASWVQQVSFDPLLISVCIKDGRPGIDAVLKKSPFCVNVVSRGKTDYLTHFKNNISGDTSSMNKVPHQKIEGKGAILKEAKSAIICKAHEIYQPGDHYLVTAEVIDGVILDNQASSKTYTRNSGHHY